MHLDGDDSCAANLPTANVAALRDAVWRVRERLADILAACRRRRGREGVANIGAVAAGGLSEAAKERRRKVVGPRRELSVRRNGGRREGREARHDGRPVERRGWEEQRCEHCFRSQRWEDARRSTRAGSASWKLADSSRCLALVPPSLCVGAAARLLNLSIWCARTYSVAFAPRRTPVRRRLLRGAPS